LTVDFLMMQMIDINCKGTLNGVAAVLPKMLARTSGHIVNISSDAGRRVFPGLGVYSASKMFIEGISQALRLENVGSGLRVTAIQVSCWLRTADKDRWL
jgi:NADP-dependent 3-hydroxy acid dehydrogenase YdfG